VAGGQATKATHLALVELKEQVLAEAVEAVEHPAEVLDAIAGLVDRALQDVLVVRHARVRLGRRTSGWALVCRQAREFARVVGKRGHTKQPPLSLTR